MVSLGLKSNKITPIPIRIKFVHLILCSLLATIFLTDNTNFALILSDIFLYKIIVYSFVWLLRYSFENIFSKKHYKYKLQTSNLSIYSIASENTHTRFLHDIPLSILYLCKCMRICRVLFYLCLGPSIFSSVSRNPMASGRYMASYRQSIRYSLV